MYNRIDALKTNSTFAYLPIIKKFLFKCCWFNLDGIMIKESMSNISPASSACLECIELDSGETVFAHHGLDGLISLELRILKGSIKIKQQALESHENFVFCSGRGAAAKAQQSNVSCIENFLSFCLRDPATSCPPESNKKHEQCCEHHSHLLCWRF